MFIMTVLERSSQPEKELVHITTAGFLAAESEVGSSDSPLGVPEDPA